MTAGNSGASPPEDDDPFGYLYEDGQAAGATPGGQGGYSGPSPQPGVPRTSYNQVRTVGSRQYGQQVPPQQQQQQYGQPPQQQYGRPGNARSGGGPEGPVAGARQVSSQHGGGRGRGPNTKGLLIGAVAVVAVVVIGITAALASGGGDDPKDQAAPSGAPTVAASEQPSKDPSDTTKNEQPTALPQQDAAALQLNSPAATSSQIPGAKAAGGSYVTLGGEGAAVTWKVDVPKGGDYTLYATYGVPGTDGKLSLFVNDQDPRSINMKNYANAPAGDWEKGWTTTYAFVDLDKGANTIKVACEKGDQCEVNLDQFSLKPGQAG